VNENNTRACRLEEDQDERSRTAP